MLEIILVSTMGSSYQQIRANLSFTVRIPVVGAYPIFEESILTMQCKEV
jgi:hypothetical protein